LCFIINILMSQPNNGTQSTPPSGTNTNGTNTNDTNTNDNGPGGPSLQMRVGGLEWEEMGKRWAWYILFFIFLFFLLTYICIL
jgi:hypothetical protein